VNAQPLPHGRGSVQSCAFLSRAREQAVSARFWIAFSVALLPAFAGVDGTVVNGTTGKPQANVVVSLVQPTQSGMENLGSVKTDAAGKFHFDKEAAGGPQLLQAIYSGVTYTKMIPPGSASTGVDVEVFDASSDAANAKVAEDFILFQPTNEKVTVQEVIVVDNASATTYNDPKKGAVHFYVPPEGAGLTVNVTGPSGMPVNRPAEKTPDAGTYRVDYPIRPGRTRFDVSYSVPAARPMVVSGKILNTGTAGLVVPPGVSLKGDNITKLGTEPQGKFVFYGVKGADYKVEIEGTAVAKAPAEPSAEDDSGQPRIEEVQPLIYQKKFLGQPVLLWILEIAFVILGLGLVLLYRSEKPKPVQAGDAGRAPQASTRKGAVSR
jgi:hypothetical protein